MLGAGLVLASVPILEVRLRPASRSKAQSAAVRPLTSCDAYAPTPA